MSTTITLYRSLRKDEIENILSRGIIARCTPCPTAGPCCDISAAAHIRSGSKAVTKSRWISTTLSEDIAALWSSTKGGGFYCKIVLNVSDHELVVVKPQSAHQIGLLGSALNFALKSEEVLVKDFIPPQCIVELSKSIHVTKKVWETNPYQFAVVGKRMNKQAKRYVVAKKVWTRASGHQQKQQVQAVKQTQQQGQQSVKQIIQLLDKLKL